MTLTYSALASLTGISIKTILCGNYQPQELGKMWMMEYFARHYDEMRAAASDPEQYDHDTSILHFFLSYVKDKSTSYPYTLKVSNKELIGKYGYWENPTTLYIGANPRPRDAIAFTYDETAQKLENQISARTQIIRVPE